MTGVGQMGKGKLGDLIERVSSERLIFSELF